MFAGFLALGLLALIPLLIWVARGAGEPEWKLFSVAVALVCLALPLFHMAMLAYLLLRFGYRTEPGAPGGLKVDVYVTAYKEPLWLLRRTLQAAVAIRYPHRTYLLDDAGRSDLAGLARELNAGYLTREDSRDHKAGNVNAALARTDGDFIAIFDADHAPEPGFLDRTLAPFEDPEVGFVQAMVTFSNEEGNVFARASAETAKDFYNLIEVGQDCCGAASLIGSNAVLRRDALESIGGYKPGLAEDLETSIALHHRGWRSAYVREPLAPGLTPADFDTFVRQQLKWASGVFEAGVGRLRRSFRGLTAHQRLCYLTRCTYYLIPIQYALGVLFVALDLIVPFADVEGLLFAGAPFLVCFLGACSYARRAWSLESSARSPFRPRASSLLFSAWPAYALAALRTLLRRPIAFRATAKTVRHGLPLWAVLPQLALVGLLVFALGWRYVHWDGHPSPASVFLALFQIASHWILFVAIYRNLRYSASAMERRVPSPAG